jgi:hypothetical protein
MAVPAGRQLAVGYGVQRRIEFSERLFPAGRQTMLIIFRSQEQTKNNFLTKD